MTTRRGFSRSTSARMALVVIPNSTSDGWNMAFWLSGSNSDSGATSSRTATPSSDQPCDLATSVSSTLVSERVT